MSEVILWHYRYNLIKMLCPVHPCYNKVDETHLPSYTTKFSHPQKNRIWRIGAHTASKSVNCHVVVATAWNQHCRPENSPCICIYLINQELRLVGGLGVQGRWYSTPIYPPPSDITDMPASHVRTAAHLTAWAKRNHETRSELPTEKSFNTINSSEMDFNLSHI